MACITVPLPAVVCVRLTRRHHDHRLVVEVQSHRLPHRRHGLLQVVQAAIAFVFT